MSRVAADWIRTLDIHMEGSDGVLLTFVEGVTGCMRRASF